jgi:hypothetical protein
MKYYLTELGAIVVALLLLAFLVANTASAQVTFPNRGGTGTSTPPTKGQVLIGNANGTYSPRATSSLGISGGSGTVTSVGFTVPTGFSISGSPVTTTGTLGLSYISGYELLKTASGTAWQNFYTAPSSRITAGNAIDWVSNTLDVVTSGDWTGTLDTYEAASLLARANHTGQQLAATISDFVATVRTSITETITGIDYSAGEFSLTSGYNIPKTASTTNWQTAYGWGNHASQGYITDGNTAWDNLYGFITGNQTITLSGDVSVSGTTAITTTVADDSHAHTGSTISGVDVSSDTNLAGDSEIVLTGDSLSIASSIARDAELHSAVTVSGARDYFTLSGQDLVRGVVDVSDDTNFTVSATGLNLTADALALTSGYNVPRTASTTNWQTAFGWGNHATAGYITGNQTITLSGDVTGSGSTAITAAVGDDSHAHTGSTLSGIDVSSDTNLAGDSEIVLTGDSLSIASAIARDAELHNAVTVGGEDYLSLSTQLITANAIDPDNLSASDFGSWSCNGTICTNDASSITEPMLNINTATAGYVLQASSTAPSGFAWVATSTLGIAGGGGGVTSVAMSVPTGLSVSGSPITTTGTLAVTLTAGYNIPLTASTTQWRKAYASTTALSATSPLNYVGTTGALSINNDGIGNTQLAFDTGQSLTTASTPTFVSLSIDTLNLTNTGTLNGLDSLDGTSITTIENAFDTVSAALETAIEAAIDTISSLTISTTLVIPFGTACDSNADGEACQDTSDEQLIVDGRVHRSVEEIFPFSLGSTSPAFASSSSKRLPRIDDGYTVTRILCDVEGGTSKVIRLYGEIITCDGDGATDDGSIASPTLAALASTTVRMGPTTGTVHWLNISIIGYFTRK